MFQSGKTQYGILLILKCMVTLFLLAAIVLWLITYLKNKESYLLPVILTIVHFAAQTVLTVLNLALLDKETNVLVYFKESYYTIMILSAWIILIAIKKKPAKYVFAGIRLLLAGISLPITFISVIRANLSYLRGGVDPSEIMFLLRNTYYFLDFMFGLIMTILLVLYIVRPKIFLKD